MAARLTAASALRMCIEVSIVVIVRRERENADFVDQSLGFDITSFEPFIPGVVPQLLSLASELDTVEGKKRVIGCLLTVIGRSETRVRANLEAVIRPSDKV